MKNNVLGGIWGPSEASHTSGVQDWKFSYGLDTEQGQARCCRYQYHSFNLYSSLCSVCSVSEHILMTTVIHCDFYFPQLILPTIPKNTFQLFMSFETGFFWKVGV